MKSKWYSILYLSILLFLSLAIFKLEASAWPFDKIKEVYSSIYTIEASFAQKIFISSLKKEREFEGDFLYKKGRGFLWRYNKPKIRYFLFDGSFIWQGEEEKPFVYKRRINREKIGGTFFDLLEDINRLDELFTLKEKKDLGDMSVMELIPKKEGQVTSAKIWIDRLNMVKKIEIYEFTGNINTINFTYTKINEPINDSKFIYKREKGKEIIESN